MHKQRSKRACPVCKSETSYFIKEFNFVLFDGHPMRDGYDLVHCSNCNFVYADTTITQHDLDDYYANLSKYESKSISTGGGYTTYDKERLIVTADYIHSQLPDLNKRILDLGCASGGLLKELKHLGYRNIAGIDPSIACVNITRREVQCDCFQFSLFDDYEETVGKFDLIILSHVMEHILDVDAAMNKLLRLLNPGGCVYIECPNASNYKNIVHSPFQEFNTEHINHFNLASFVNLFSAYGFTKQHGGTKLMKLASNQDYDAVYSIFRRGSDKALSNAIGPDEHILSEIALYISRSEVIFEHMNRQINNALNWNGKIALLGIGQLAFKLLLNPTIQFDSDMLFLFDNNAMNVGKTINGIKVRPGEQIAELVEKYQFPIIITSTIFEKELREQLIKMFQN